MNGLTANCCDLSVMCVLLKLAGTGAMVNICCYDMNWDWFVSLTRHTYWYGICCWYLNIANNFAWCKVTGCNKYGVVLLCLMWLADLVWCRLVSLGCACSRCGVALPCMVRSGLVWFVDCSNIIGLPVTIIINDMHICLVDFSWACRPVIGCSENYLCTACPEN